ncbi:MAG: 3-hydroxyacyl-ACP dehydratase FabZ [Chlamydiales bacterium]|nr:3-hydroxyacyl-ACP dehydratase FabZ [Chlamydiales bacterium]
MSNELPSPVMGIKQIATILPHNYPFLLVDRIIKIDLEKNLIVGQKNVTVNEPFFKGHFPGTPIMPGVLILEALAQTGGILIDQKGFNDRTALLMTVNNAKFRKPVFPGDVLYLHIEGIHFSKRGGKVLAKAIVDEKVVAEAEIGFGMMDKELIGT